MGIDNINFPFDESAERAVIGTMLYSPNTIEMVISILKEEDFYFENYKILFNLLKELWEENQTNWERIIFINFLEKKGYKDKFSESFLEELVLEAVPPSMIEGVCKVIKEKASIRTVINLGIKLINEAKETKEIDVLLDEIEKTIYEITERNIGLGYYELKEILEEALSTIESFMNKKELVTGLGSGFIDLDRHTTGFHPSDLIILAARPGMGKTSFMLSMALNMASNNKPVAIFSLEMSKEQLVMRILSNKAKIFLQKLRTGMLSKEDYQNLKNTVEELKTLPIYIDDSPTLSIADLRIKARKLKKEKNIELIAIDYLQLVRPVRLKGSRQEEVAEISRSLKALAKELEIPVLALAQLSRQTEHRSDKRPQLSDLRESGQIEQDADLILFLHRPEYYKKNPLPEEKGIVELIIAKQRQGPTGIVKLAFVSEFVSFHTLSESFKEELQENDIVEESSLDDYDIDF